MEDPPKNPKKFSSEDGLAQQYSRLIRTLNPEGDSEALDNLLMYAAGVGAIIGGLIGLVKGYVFFGVGGAVLLSAGGALLGGIAGALAFSILQMVLWLGLIAIPILLVVGAIVALWGVKF